MRSTFMGLETARRAMYAQQTALYTTGQNIANANTPGYTRQRVNFVQTEPYPNAAMNRPQIPGQIGTGVTTESVQRIRESFLDFQYRGENSKVGYWEARANALSKMEQVMNEPSDSGLAKTMDMFWQSLQDLAVDPQNTGARSVVRQRGVAVAETFNYLSDTLTAEKNKIKSEIDVSVKDLNSIVYQLNQVNDQIGRVEPHGYLPNDLYDERDRLIDELSSLVSIKVEYTPPTGNAAATAEGKATIKLINDVGAEIGTLIDENGSKEISINYNGQNGSVASISIGGTAVGLDSFKSSGKLKGLIESYGYEDANGNVKGLYPEMLAELDNLAYTFATEFNSVHEQGMSPNEIKNGQQNIPFFADENGAITDRNDFASRIVLAQDIYNSLDNIANADGSDPSKATLGDSSNILKLAEVINSDFDYGQNNQLSDFRNYYEGLIGGMAVNAQEATRLTNNTTTLRQAVEDRRLSNSSVSLDEEMTNMIQFQHAYNAAARMISLTDELLDTIINRMGR